MITLQECLREMKAFNGKESEKINQIWEIPYIERKFQNEINQHHEWVELLIKHEPRYAILETTLSSMQQCLRLFSLAIFMDGSERVPVVVLILVN